MAKMKFSFGLFEFSRLKHLRQIDGSNRRIHEEQAIAIRRTRIRCTSKACQQSVLPLAYQNKMYFDKHINKLTFQLA